MKAENYEAAGCMANSLKARAAACVLSALSLTACKTTDDPREGGFIGGLHGLSTGAYEERIEEREARLQRLRQLQDELEAERQTLETQQQESRSIYQRDRARLAELSRETRLLNQKLQSLRGTERAREAQRQNLLQRIGDLQQKIDKTAAATPPDTQALTAERNALEEEYRLLLDIYREISQ